MTAKANSERGAALILVLLLVATLSFIALAISERTVLAAGRSFNARARSEMLWRVYGVEALAASAIESAMTASDGKLTLTSPLIARQIDLPMNGGIARLRVFDRTRCFNLNSLVEETESGSIRMNEAAVTEFGELVRAAGATVIDAESVTASVVDWIDTDTIQEPDGAEDGVYTLRPTPYRTGSQRLVHLSELRAVDGIDRTAYAALRSLTCALPNAAPSPINVNLLSESDAPLISAMVNGTVGVAPIREAIEARPPEGYAAGEDFWKDDVFADAQIGEEIRGRLALSSRYLEVNGTIEYYESSLDLSLLFEVDDSGRAHLLSRRLGTS